MLARHGGHDNQDDIVNYWQADEYTDIIIKELEETLEQRQNYWRKPFIRSFTKNKKKITIKS